uniref:IBB domain-containing protein n=1 Tax=Oryza rufipogon TaxID=4529 RepID=A0A0E0QWS8_ORYRU
MDGIPKLTANELRRQRDRERYAALSVEEKAARVQKNRENRKRKKSASTSGTAIISTCAFLHTRVFLHTCLQKPTNLRKYFLRHTCRILLHAAQAMSQACPSLSRGNGLRVLQSASLHA